MSDFKVVDTQDITIKELKTLRRQLGDDIESLVRTFMDKTGVNVINIGYDYTPLTGCPAHIAVAIKTEV